MGSCTRKFTKKYRSRSSPPFPANECCNTTKQGNDGQLYQSRRAHGGTCRWTLATNKRMSPSSRRKARARSRSRSKSPARVARKRSGSRKARKRSGSARKRTRSTSRRNKRSRSRSTSRRKARRRSTTRRR